MKKRELVHPSCRYCRPLSYFKGETLGEGLERYFCFGERDSPSTANPIDKYNFCVYTPFKGVVQFHVCQGDMEWWMALFLAAWREITGQEQIFWETIETIATGLKFKEDVS